VLDAILNVKIVVRIDGAICWHSDINGTARSGRNNGTHSGSGFPEGWFDPDFGPVRGHGNSQPPNVSGVDSHQACTSPSPDSSISLPRGVGTHWKGIGRIEILSLGIPFPVDRHSPNAFRTIR